MEGHRRHRERRLPRRRAEHQRLRLVVLWAAATLIAAGVGATVALLPSGDQAPVGSASSTLGQRSPAPVPGAPPTATPLNSLAPPAAPPPADEPADLAADFDELQRATAATIGLVVTPVGNDSPSLQLGDWTSVGPAWSTIKVPLAIASINNQTSDIDLITAAITQSDNAAAEQLWADLGEPGAAAAEVEEVLADAGDPTRVQSQRVRPEFSAFGQTRWPLARQADFLSTAVCDPRNVSIVELMGQITAGHSWGLGTLPASKFKGGWGPSVDGSYLVRQIGVVETPSGRAAVAMAATPDSGRFDDGTAALTAAARWLGTRTAELPAGHCN